MQDKEFSKNNLCQFYYDCPLFKKYCELGLWFGSFEEYKNIKYCEEYLQKYIYFFLLNRNLLKYQRLVTDPHFIKFLDSRFFCHINSHFLIAFYKNSFLFSFPRSKLKIEIFVENYFQIYLQEKLEKEFLTCVIKFTNKFTFNFAELYSSSFCLDSLFRTNLYYNFFLNKRLKLKKNDIQLLFESNKFFNNFSEKKKSIGLHNSVIIKNNSLKS